MQIFKFINTVDGEDDPIFVEASTVKDARTMFATMLGPIPDSMLIVVPVDALPEGEELLNELY